MDEEIGRILQLLEEKKIDAAAAERLIYAVRGTRKERTASPHSDNPFDAHWNPPLPPLPDMRELIDILRSAQKQIHRRRHRHYWWHYYTMNHWQRQQRQRRVETMSTYERVRFVLMGATLWEEVVLHPTVLLQDVLRRERVAWECFHYGLEEEFDRTIPLSDLAGLTTVQAVADYLDVRSKTEPDSDSVSGVESGPDTEPQTFTNRDEGDATTGESSAEETSPPPAEDTL